MRQITGPDTGGPHPRAAHSGGTGHVCLGGLVLLFISPAALLAAVATVFLVLRQTRRHWWEWALVALGVAVAVGVIMQLVTGNVAAAHFGGYPAALQATIPHGHPLSAWPSAWLPTIPLGIPIGVAAGAGYVGLSESWAGGAEWHSIELRRRAVDQGKKDQKVQALLIDTEAQQRCAAPPLGVCRAGDLKSWIEGDFVVTPPGKFPAMGVLGESGAGKTVTLQEASGIWGAAGRKLFFADFKGSDTDLPQRILAAYRNGRGRKVACAVWPAQPLDMWRGSPAEVANRLLCVQDFSEPYYESVAQTAVRLAVEAPDIDGSGPVADSVSFMRRLNAEFLKRAWEHTDEAENVQALIEDRKAFQGVRLRYAGFFRALAGHLDHGWSFEDVDIGVLSVPTLAKPSDAMAVARMILTDFGSYCMARKPRIGEDVTFIVDEFSAVTSAAPMVIQLAERVRDVGGQVVVSAQSYEGLGRDDDERRRMKAALAPGGLIVHRMADPEPVIDIGGSVRALEQTWQLEPHGHTGLGSAKMAHKYRVDPDEVRQLPTGEAFVITHGRAAHMSVIRRRIPEPIRAQARQLVSAARWQAGIDLSHGRAAVAQDWWEVPLAVESAPRYLELPSGSLGELGTGEPPPELPPVPAPTDPRIVIAVAAYVRAGQIAEARKIAAAHGIADPDRYVARLAAERAARTAGSSRRRRSA